MENKKISVIFFGIGLLLVMLFFVLPIRHETYWLTYSFGLIIQITPHSTTFLYIIHSFLYLPFSLTIFIFCLISIIIWMIIALKKKVSRNYNKFMRRMAFVIGSLATGFVLLFFILGHIVFQFFFFLYDQSFFLINIWILTWFIITFLVVYIIIGITFALKSRIKKKFKFTWIICGFFVPIPLLTLMDYSGFTIALFLPFIGTTFIFLEHLISHRICSKPD